MTKKNTTENQSKNEKTKRKKPWWKRVFKIVFRTILLFIILFVLLILFIRSPWGQNIIVGEATKYISKKTQTEVGIEKLFITLKGNVNLEGLYVEDQQGDTLVYSKELKIDIPFIPIIKGQPISLNHLYWDGLKANVSRKDSLEGYNFQFIIDAFSSEEPQPEIQETEKENQNLPKINIGNIDFSNFNLKFDDEVMGINAQIDLGKFKFIGKNIDLNKMQYEAREIALENTNLSYIQTKPFAAVEDTTTTTLPFLSLDKLKLNNVKAFYQSKPDEMEAEADLNDFLLELPKADLANQDVEINQLLLHKSFLKLKLEEESKAEEELKETGKKVEEKVEEAFVFEWPDWEIKVNTIGFEENHLIYQKGEKPTSLKEFNPDYIDLSDFTLAIHNIELTKDEKAKADFEKLSFQEKDGLDLKQISFGLDLNNTDLAIENLLVETSKNKLNSHLKITYDSLNDLIDKPEKSKLDIDLKDFSLNLTEAFYFAPDLRTNEYFYKLSRRKTSGKLKAKGSLAHLNLTNLNVKWRNTHLNTKGKFKNLTDQDNLYAAVDYFVLTSNRSDVLQFIEEEDIGISIPETIYLQSKLHGGLTDLKTQTVLKIPEGEINLDGGFTNKEFIAFNADLDVIEFDLGKLLDNPEIGKIELNLKTQGEGNTIEKLTADLHAEFQKLEFNDYDFSALKLEGKLVEGEGNILLNYLDDNLDMSLNSKVKLDSLYQKVSADLDVVKADLNKLNLIDKEIKTNLFLIADFENDDGKMTVESHLAEGNISYDKKTYILGPLNMGGLIQKDSTSFALNSKILSGQLAANAEPQQIGKAVERQLKRYFRDSLPPIDTLRNPIKLQADMQVSPHPLLTDVFVQGIVEMDTLKLEADFDQEKDFLSSNINLSYLNFENNIIDNLYFDINSARDVAQFVFGFENVDAGSFGMNRTYLTGDLTEGVLTANFFSFDNNNEIFYSFHSEVSGRKNEMKFHLLPYNLTLNNEDWEIPEDNEIVIKEKSIEAHNFHLTKENRKFEIANDLIETKRNNIGLGFKDFKLETLIALLNPQEHLASGNLQGKIVAVNPMEKIGFLADFGIDELEVMQAPLGDLGLKAFSRDLNRYRFKMDLKGEDVDLDLNGDFANDEEPRINADLKLNEFGFKTIAALSQKELTHGKGYLSGEFSIKGPTKSPDYSGFFKFNEASFKVAKFNSEFVLNDDEIDIANQKITLNNFTIEDENGKEFGIDGSITTKKLLNPKFNLNLNTKDFQLMNSTAEDNKLFYGKLNFDLDGTIKGSASNPEVDVRIKINKDTDFIYALSAAQAGMDSQEGVVEFVNRTAPNYVIEEETDSINTANIPGMNLHANLNIEKGSKFGVIMDPRTKDKAEVSGDGSLDFRMNPNGQMNLSGRYTIDEGFYKMSLYNLVRREFSFQSGSSITWAGDPMDADLDVTAIYEVKASPAGLMGGGASEISEEDRNKYKQRLPFLVSLGVGGTIDQPDLRFGLDMEEESKGAMGGAVYSQLSQMKDDEGEVNKQVFSLLVLNRFFPESGSDGGGGGFATVARNNLNQALSDQLNNFSDQLTGDSGFRLNFDLDSYETYSGGSSQQRTDLDISAEQRLFNDRLVVKAGTEMNVQGDLQPGEERPLLGNVSIEYLLTEDGRWRINGFRKNEYENVIDGQVFTNGIGLLFQKDFDRFGYLWRSLIGNPQKYYAKKRKERQKKKEERKIKKEAVENPNTEKEEPKNQE